MPFEWTEAAEDKLTWFRNRRASWPEIAEYFSISQEAARSKWRHMLSKSGATPEELASLEREFEVEGDRATLTCLVEHAPRNDQELCAFANVDQTVWRVKKWRAGVWHTTVKTGVRGDESIHKKRNYKVTAEFERIMPQSDRAALDLVFERLESRSPKWRKPPKWSKPNGEGLLVYSLYDVHFGKLAWAKETGFNDYDLDITSQLYHDSVERLIQRSQGWPVDRILFPFGHDFLHIDSSKNETTSGTAVDTDGRFAKIIATAEIAVVEVVERLASIAPVDVILVQGNHDYHTSYMLARVLSAWFRNNDRVTVDSGPNPMKGYEYHQCLFTLVHGDSFKKSKLNELPHAMSLMHRDKWSDAKCCEIHQGHHHTQKGFIAPGYHEHAGVMVRYLASLSATDHWHARNLFVGNRRTAEVLMYDRESYIGSVMA